MHEITGAAMLLAAGGLYWRYRPTVREQRLLCAMTALMGMMSLTVGEGSLGVETVQACLSFVVALCCALSFRRGQVREKRKSAPCVCKTQSRAEEKNCA